MHATKEASFFQISKVMAKVQAFCQRHTNIQTVLKLDAPELHSRGIKILQYVHPYLRLKTRAAPVLRTSDSGCGSGRPARRAPGGGTERSGRGTCWWPRAGPEGCYTTAGSGRGRPRRGAGYGRVWGCAVVCTAGRMAVVAGRSLYAGLESGEVAWGGWFGGWCRTIPWAARGWGSCCVGWLDYMRWCGVRWTRREGFVQRKGSVFLLQQESCSWLCPSLSMSYCCDSHFASLEGD